MCACGWICFDCRIANRRDWFFFFLNYTQATKAIEILGCARLLYYALGTASHSLLDAGDGRVEASWKSFIDRVCVERSAIVCCGSVVWVRQSCVVLSILQSCRRVSASV